jgi:hypothetical protein
MLGLDFAKIPVPERDALDLTPTCEVLRILHRPSGQRVFVSDFSPSGVENALRTLQCLIEFPAQKVCGELEDGA